MSHLLKVFQTSNYMKHVSCDKKRRFFRNTTSDVLVNNLFCPRIGDGGLVSSQSTLNYLSNDTKNSFVTINSRLSLYFPILFLCGGV